MKRKLAEQGKLPKQYRHGTITLRKRAADDGDGADAESAAEDAAESTFDVAISSEQEVERWWGVEVLSHDAGSVDMTRLGNGAAVLVDHGGDQVGVVEDARLDKDRVLRGTIRFSKSARGQEVAQDVRDGIRRNVSVGYFVKQMKLTEERQTAGKDTTPVYTVTRWQPAEVSIVSVPADTSVGFGRSESPNEECAVVIEGDQPGEEGNMLLNQRKLNQGGAGGGAESPAAPSVEAMRTAEEKRATAIRDALAGAGPQFRGLEAQFVASTMSADEVAARIMEAKRTVGTPQAPEERLRERVGKDLKDYSYLRAIRGAVALSEGGKFDGLEAQVHQELRNAMPEGYVGKGGVLTPTSNRTTLTSVDPAKGVEVVPEQFGPMIELLRPNARVIEAGATVLTGLTGPVAFPKQTAGATVFWVPENPTTNVADGEPSLGLALMQPKTLQGNIPFTRQLLMQGSLDVEGWVRRELAIGHGLALDKGALHGRGNNGEPTGIYAAPSTYPKDFGSSVGNVTLAALLDMVGNVFDKNAQADTMGWMTTPLMATILRGTLEFSAAGSSTLWQGRISDGNMLGYAARSTTQASKVMSASLPTGGASHCCVFGNWQDLFLALFGALELVVDPYSNKKKAIIEVTSFQLGDVLLRHGESFAKGTNMTIT